MTARKRLGLLLGALLFLLVFGSQSAFAEVTNKTLTLGQEYVSGQILNAKDVDRYKITIPSAGTLSITYQGMSIRNSYFKLLNENLDSNSVFFTKQLYTSSETNPLTNTQSVILEAGTYYLDVYGYSSNTGTYRVKGSFNPANNQETEPNDEFTSAMTLAAGRKLTGLISATDRIDFYKITLPSVQKVKITYQIMYGHAYFSLWDSEFIKKKGADVYSGSETSPALYTYEEELPAGVYYIKISPYGSNTGRYYIQWTGTNIGVSPTPTPTPVPTATPTPKPTAAPTPAPTAAPTQAPTDPNAGQNVNVSGQQYTVTPGGEVEYEQSSNNAKTVTIPATIKVNGTTYKVTSISTNAFRNNQYITKVVIGKNVKTIGVNAFLNCRNLKTVKFGKNVRTIGNYAFYNCSSLKKVDLPANVTKIGKKAFFKCTKLKTLIVRSKKLTKAKVGTQAFKRTPSGLYVYVPSSKVKQYRSVLKGISSGATIVPIM